MDVVTACLPGFNVEEVHGVSIRNYYLEFQSNVNLERELSKTLIFWHNFILSLINIYVLEIALTLIIIVCGHNRDPFCQLEDKSVH